MLAASRVAADDGKLTGTVIGTTLSVDYSSGQSTQTVNTREQAFDGKLDTFFASWERSYTWVGLDLGQPCVITKVGWSPRNDGLGPGRVVLGVFEGANREDFMDGVPLYIITDKGTIACKGKTLMTGYVGDPEQTAAILRDGVVYTSDIGTIDEEGMLHLTGREDDVINGGGFKGAPTEVEDAALSFPDVEDCICISVDHVITGKALKLLVVMKEGKNLNRRALAIHLKSMLEPYKIPLLYAQTEKIERTFNGKINRKYYRSLG